MRTFAARPVLSVLLLASLARAAPPEAATAEALFDDGRRLIHEGKIADGCKKLEASQKLDPGLGTLLNLADCHARLGKLATAWAEYREGAAWAERDGDVERARMAARRAVEIAPTVSHLTIELAPGAQIEGMHVLKDGSELPLETLGTALPVDPGEHVVTVTAPEHVERRLPVTIAGSGAPVTLRVPPLDLERQPAPVVAQSAKPIVKPRSPRSEAPRSAPKAATVRTDVRRPAAIGLVAAGAISLGVGSFFGIRAASRWSNAKSGCASPPDGCSDAAVQRGHAADSDATVATIMVASGLVAIGAGTWLWVSAGAPAHSETAMLGVRGIF